MSALNQTATRFATEEMSLLTSAAALDARARREVLERLFRSSSADVRQRAIRCAAMIMPDDVLAGYLRNGEDDVLRNAGLESLKLRAHRSFGLAVALLDDDDHDVVLQAVLLLDASRSTRAWPHLRPRLRDADTNIVQAVITAAGHLGGPDAVGDLLPFLDGDAWLQVAAVQALGDLRCPSAVPHLWRLFDDPFVQVFAAEAVARIGGRAAAEALCAFWLDRNEELDTDTYVPLLALLLKQEPAHSSPALLTSIVPYLGSECTTTSVAAAWSIVALGPSAHDAAALDVIASVAAEGFEAPPCLRRRTDLVVKLIERNTPLREAGYRIAAQCGYAFERDHLALLLAAYPPASLDDVAPLLTGSIDIFLAQVVVDLWLQRRESRGALREVIRANPGAILAQAARIQGTDRVTLLEAAGEEPESIARELAMLSGDERWAACAAVEDRRIIELFPWTEWLAADRATAARALGTAVMRTHATALLPLIRSELAGEPRRELIAAAAALRDTGSVPLLLPVIDSDDRLLRAVSLEALGRIGDDIARAELRSRCIQSADPGAACRALAACAEERDCELLRHAAERFDISVRLAVIPVLASHPTPENRRFLGQLLFDASAAVAQRAHGVLEVIGSES
jgi:HEAT repeat protein